jgi:hypothetical protein
MVFEQDVFQSQVEYGENRRWEREVRSSGVESTCLDLLQSGFSLMATRPAAANR